MKPVAVLALFAAIACGPKLSDGWKRDPDALIKASGNPERIRALMSLEVMIGGLWFPKSLCGEFWWGRVVSEQLDELASCLASLKWRPSVRRASVDGVTVLEAAF